jgi:adenylate kinase
MQDHAHVVILLGPPGAGKGTQSARLSAALGIPAISTGEILRSECQSGSDLGREVEAVLARGELVDDRTMNEMVSRRLREPDCVHGCILDGYPRTLAQARHLDTLNFAMPRIFDFIVSARDVISRLGGRRYCPECGQTFSKSQVCSKDGSPLLQRDDDKPAVIRERLRVYRRNMDKLVRFYRSRDYHPIHATRAPDMVFEELLRLLNTGRQAARNQVMTRSRAYA